MIKIKNYLEKALFTIFVIFSFCYGNTKDIKIDKNEKIIIFAPHPDDEILSCGGLIQKIIKNNGKVYIVYLTNGDHNQIPYRIYEKRIILKPSDYIKLGEIRRMESVEATKILGVPSKNLIFLGYPDFGTLKMWEDYWNENKRPFKSFLTRASYVPYKENYSYGKPYVSESILSDIKKIIEEIKPSKIFVTSPYDTNVDHRALYNFVKVSLLELENEKIMPECFFYLIHFKNYPLKSSGKFVFPEILNSFEIYSTNLKKEEKINKKRSIECFKSQLVFRKNWFYSFVKNNEIFYKEQDLNLKDNIILESEREAEFENYKNLSYPFYVNLKKEGEFLNIEFVHKKKIIIPVEYIFYLFPFKKEIEFLKMPKVKINLKKKDEVLFSSDFVYHKELKYEKSKNKISFKISLLEINNPECLFFSANIKIGGINYDFIPWEVIKIEQD